MSKTSILIADDFPIARRRLCKLLEDQPDWKVVGEASHAFDAFDKAVVLNPDLVILDDVTSRLGGVSSGSPNSPRFATNTPFDLSNPR